MVKPSTVVGGVVAQQAVAPTLTTAHSRPARAAQYAREPWMSCAEFSCCVFEKLTMNAPKAASINTKKMAAMAAKPCCAV